MSLSQTRAQRRVHRRLPVRIALTAVEAFVAVGAIYGSIMLITDAWRLDRSMLGHLPVDSWTLPGVALAVLIAVPYVVSTILVVIGHSMARGVSWLAGTLLVGWIVVQIALIEQYFFLQPVMGLCGLLTIGLAVLLPPGRNRHEHAG